MTAELTALSLEAPPAFNKTIRCQLFLKANPTRLMMTSLNGDVATAGLQTSRDVTECRAHLKLGFKQIYRETFLLVVSTSDCVSHIRRK